MGKELMLKSFSFRDFMIFVVSAAATSLNNVYINSTTSTEEKENLVPCY